MNGYYTAIHHIILRKNDCDWQFLFCPLDLSFACISESAFPNIKIDLNGGRDKPHKLEDQRSSLKTLERRAKQQANSLRSKQCQYTTDKIQQWQCRKPQIER